jgi:protein phosphatase 2C family protein 2/3
VSNFTVNNHNEMIDKSGSCAVVALIIDDVCYIANVDDSRAVCH